MGISGLLPALRSIQVTKHLSEFAGQTIAVDGYVWLHRGIMTCATELATKKPTHKYVDYCMHRVRLLRHHNIEPYVVFDGGPLPAKKGTEIERRKRRQDHLAQGNALAAQGKHGQAREFYVKCVDVTPQMAFQFIKALRAENVRYVVAPYEADAQLAYLERIGLVNGILTEDSDLLVFGCQNVLFKLDTVANTVVHIMRRDFSSVSRSESEISLVGWSDAQFRAMAILSGCDYLPSIPGVGLKTACALLRKWKTADQVVRAILLEGKKSVPQGYMDNFKLADKCFQHQRVYCPNQEMLVHLTNVDSEWDEEADTHVGSNLEPSLAKKLANGNIDPITLLPMEDINPSFVPRTKSLAPISRDGNRRDKEKGKPPSTRNQDGILSFFGPNPIIPARERRCSSTPIYIKKGRAGKASGKRTLAEVMDSDIAAKRPKQISKFFEPSGKGTQVGGTLGGISGSSRERKGEENIYVIDDDDDDTSDVGSDLSIIVQADVDIMTEMDLEELSHEEVVNQEEGYVSPTPSRSGDVQDLSSPIRPPKAPIQNHPPNSRDTEFGAEVISSPPARNKQPRSFRLSPEITHRTRSLDLPRMNPSREHRAGRSGVPSSASFSFFPGPDLRTSFTDERSSDIDCSDDEAGHASGPKSSKTPTPSPSTPLAQEDPLVALGAHNGDPEDFEDFIAAENRIRSQAVMTGWRQKWALPDVVNPHKHGASRKLRRRETNITPTGRHTIFHPESQLRSSLSRDLHSTRKVMRVMKANPRRTQGRNRLLLFEPVRKGTSSGPEVIDLSCDVSENGENKVLPVGRTERFR